MNTMAVTLMQQNNQDEAIASFQRALTCLRRQLVLPAEDSNFRDPPWTATNHGSSAPAMDITEAMQIHPSDNKVVYSVSVDHTLYNTNTNVLSTSPDNPYAFYNQAFVFSSNVAGEFPLVSESIILAVLLFNVGLAFHGKAVRSGASRELRRALKLYKMSLVALQNGDVSQVLHLALLNNMGYIHSHFYEWEDMKQCREILDLQFMSTWCNISSKDEFTDEDYIFFSFVLLTNYCVSHSPVPPAA
jgi:hypothetical protein